MLIYLQLYTKQNIKYSKNKCTKYEKVAQNFLGSEKKGKKNRIGHVDRIKSTCGSANALALACKVPFFRFSKYCFAK